MSAGVKIVWSMETEDFIRKNFHKMTNKQLSAALNLKITALRMKCYEMGLKRMELEYWTNEQTDYLVKNFQVIGDIELAEIFNKKWLKSKGWTNKHIEKKRKYLKLKRTPHEIETIKQRNVDNGRFLLCPVKRWLVTGQAKEGEIRMWRESAGRLTPRIKISGKFLHWGRWAWEKFNGPIPPGMNVVFKDNNPQNTVLENLVLLTDGELSRRNSQTSSQGLSDNYVAGMLTHKRPDLREAVKADKSLIELKRKQLILNRTIYEQQELSEKAGRNEG